MKEAVDDYKIEIKEIEIEIKELEIQKMQSDSKKDTEAIQKKIDNFKSEIEDIKRKFEGLRKRESKAIDFVFRTGKQFIPKVVKFLDEMGFAHQNQVSGNQVQFLVIVYNEREKLIITDRLLSMGIGILEENKRRISMRNNKEQLDAEDSVIMNPEVIEPEMEVEEMYRFIVTYKSPVSGITTSINVTEENYKSVVELEKRVITELGDKVQVVSVIDYDTEIPYLDLALTDDAKLNQEFVNMLFEDHFLLDKISLLEENGFDLTIANIKEIETFIPTDDIVDFPSFVLSKSNKSLYDALMKNGSMAYFNIVGWINELSESGKLIYVECMGGIVYSFVDTKSIETEATCRGIKKKVKETGEWQDDSEGIAWKKALDNILKQMGKIRGFQYIPNSVRGFDMYQGPYGYIKYKGKQYKVWTFSDKYADEGIYIENFPIKNPDFPDFSGWAGDWNIDGNDLRAF